MRHACRCGAGAACSASFLCASGERSKAVYVQRLCRARRRPHSGSSAGVDEVQAAAVARATPRRRILGPESVPRRRAGSRRSSQHAGGLYSEVHTRRVSLSEQRAQQLGVQPAAPSQQVAGRRRRCKLDGARGASSCLARGWRAATCRSAHAHPSLRSQQKSTAAASAGCSQNRMAPACSLSHVCRTGGGLCRQPVAAGQSSERTLPARRRGPARGAASLWPLCMAAVLLLHAACAHARSRSAPARRVAAAVAACFCCSLRRPAPRRRVGGSAAPRTPPRARKRGESRVQSEAERAVRQPLAPPLRPSPPAGACLLPASPSLPSCSCSARRRRRSACATSGARLPLFHLRAPSPPAPRLRPLPLPLTFHCTPGPLATGTLPRRRLPLALPRPPAVSSRSACPIPLSSPLARATHFPSARLVDAWLEPSTPVPPRQQASRHLPPPQLQQHPRAARISRSPDGAPTCACSLSPLLCTPSRTLPRSSPSFSPRPARPCVSRAAARPARPHAALLCTRPRPPALLTRPRAPPPRATFPASILTPWHAS